MYNSNMKKILFLQSWYSKITDNWYEWLKRELDASGYETHFEDIPEMRKDTPDMNTILTYIESLHFIDENTTIIAHSLGCLLALRLGEHHSFKKMILVSGWDFDDLTTEHSSFWKNKINHDKIKSHVKEICVIHSDTDPYITAFSAREMSKRLGAEFLLIKNGGHITAKDGFTEFPQLLKLL